MSRHHWHGKVHRRRSLSPCFHVATTHSSSRQILGLCQRMPGLGPLYMTLRRCRPWNFILYGIAPQTCSDCLGKTAHCQTHTWSYIKRSGWLPASHRFDTLRHRRCPHPLPTSNATKYGRSATLRTVSRTSINMRRAWCPPHHSPWTKWYCLSRLIYSEAPGCGAHPLSTLQSYLLWTLSTAPCDNYHPSRALSYLSWTSWSYICWLSESGTQISAWWNTWQGQREATKTIHPS